MLAELAPDGTGEILRNWLPGAVASTIATHAARILDLETPEQGTPVPDGGGPPRQAAPAPDGFGSAPTYVFSGTPARHRRIDVDPHPRRLRCRMRQRPRAIPRLGSPPRH